MSYHDDYQSQPDVESLPATPAQPNLFLVKSVNGKYLFNANPSANTTIDLIEGTSYTFDLSDSSNANHPFLFSTTSNGIHGGGEQYLKGVSISGIPGTSSALTRITLESGAPTLYYYCSNHSGMGGQINTIDDLKYTLTPSVATINEGAVLTSTVVLTNSTKAELLSGGVERSYLRDLSGIATQVGDTISVRYTGQLNNGTIFDSNSNGIKPEFSFLLGAGKVIKGWDTGLLGVNVGDVLQLYIPANQAYGNNSIGPIPANSPLNFQIEVLGRSNPNGSERFSASPQLYYALSGPGITAADFSAGALTGEGSIDATGKFRFSHTFANDHTTEGLETVEIKLFSDSERLLQLGTTSIVTIADTSRKDNTTFVVTAQNGKYRLNGEDRDAVSLNLLEGNVYIFDQSNASNGNHPFQFSTTSNGTHGGGEQYIKGVITSGIPGSIGAFTKLTLEPGSPTLYYFCKVHSGMGGQINTIDESTYTLTPSAATINEGEVLTNTVSTTNVASGTKLYFALGGTGITSADFSAGALTGEGITDAAGRFSFSHSFANDPLKEGIETLEITLFFDNLLTIQVGKTASVNINDTSFGYSYFAAAINKALKEWNIFAVDSVVKAGDIVNQWFGVETPVALQVQDPTESKLLDITTSSWTEKVKINRVAKASDKGDTIEGKQKDSSSTDIVGSVLTGGKGNDSIQAKAGWDMVDGGDGDDLVKTGNGRDILTGGTGRDELWGGFGWNTYKGDKDGFSDLIVIKSDQYLPNPTLGNKSGNNSDGLKTDIIENLDSIDKIMIQGVETNQITFASNATAHGLTGIGIYSKGFIEVLYTGADLTLAQLTAITTGDASAAVMNNTLTSYGVW